MIDELEQRFRRVAPAGAFCSLRYVRESFELLQVRQGVPMPVQSGLDRGAMVTVIDGGGFGYAATSDLSESGLRDAVGRATQWARRSAGRLVVDVAKLSFPHPTGEAYVPPEVPWESGSLGEKFDLLRAQCDRLKTDDRIVDWEAMLWATDTETLQLTSEGGRVHERHHYIVPNLSVTASADADAVSRSLGGRGTCRQGGLEVLDAVGFHDAPERIAEEALELLSAPNCPTGTMSLLLAPDQMILQIHESIGHPLEYDRILGDERNYAGTSFVTPEMIGSYRYGSDLLNVTFDPTRPEQFATYAYDDEGAEARKEYIIREGILERGLGGLVSQQRLSLPGVANSRACSWNRPPIDRMANLNLECGQSTFDDMVASIERGVYMKANCSWSIDDSRNKFQFGCEWGQVIEDGQLKGVVKKPNYRGVSATFWRNLSRVGDESTWDLLGTPFCGKGEPNQCVRVGHASPACVFDDVEVFGGA